MALGNRAGLQEPQPERTTEQPRLHRIQGRQVKAAVALAVWRILGRRTSGGRPKFGFARFGILSLQCLQVLQTSFDWVETAKPLLNEVKDQV